MAGAGLGALLLATFLQLSLPGGVPVWGLEPNLVLALVVAWAWVRGPRMAFAWAVVGGLLLDLTGGGPLGVHALALLVAAYAVGLLRSLLGHRGRPLVVPAAAIGGALYGGLVLISLHLFSGDAVTVALAVATVGGGAGSGAVLSVPFALLFVALERSLAARRSG